MYFFNSLMWFINLKLHTFSNLLHNFFITEIYSVVCIWFAIRTNKLVFHHVDQVGVKIIKPRLLITIVGIDRNLHIEQQHISTMWSSSINCISGWSVSNTSSIKSIPLQCAISSCTQVLIAFIRAAFIAFRCALLAFKCISFCCNNISFLLQRLHRIIQICSCSYTRITCIRCKYCGFHVREIMFPVLQESIVRHRSPSIWFHNNTINPPTWLHSCTFILLSGFSVRARESFFHL